MSTKNNKETKQFLEKISGPLTFGSLLRAIRQGEEMTYAEFSKLLHMSRGHLGDIEQGRRAVSATRAARFAKILGYSEAQFVRLALQDEIKRSKLKLLISVEAA